MKRFLAVLLTGLLVPCLLLVLLAVTCYPSAQPAPQTDGSREPSGPERMDAAQDTRLSAAVPYAADEDWNTAPETDAPSEDGEAALIAVEDSPDTAIEVSPAALTLEEIRTFSFSDVPAEDPRADYIAYAAFCGILQGADDTHFDPESYVTRAQLVTVLYRMSGADTLSYAIVFSDVPFGEWYSEAVAWAVQAGIASGTGDGLFAPSEEVTREQLAAFLYRFAAYQDGKDYDTSLAAYQDGASVPEYARLPLAWALENRIFSGMIAETIHPGLPVSRGQLAQALVALSACSSQEPLAQALTEQLHIGTASISLAHHDEIQAQVDSIAAKYGAIGLQAAVVENGRVTDSFNYGWATKGTDPMTSDNVIRTASITKVGVGLAAMILWEDGVIDLDESIGTYWGFPVWNRSHPNNPITIRSLLSHTSSIPVLEDSTSLSYSSVKARLQSGGFTRGVPGSIGYWNYNNYAFGVLGLTLELASGRRLDDIMQDRLWSIMGANAAFESGRVPDTSKIATVYYHGGSVSRTAVSAVQNKGSSAPGSSGAYFAGSMTTSATDMAKMVSLLASDGRYEGLQLLKPETVALMEQRYDRQLSDGTYQALPLRSQDNIYGRARLYYHTGSSNGLYNLMSYDPDTGDGVVVLTTGASGSKDGNGLYAVCGNISKYIYELLARER